MQHTIDIILFGPDLPLAGVATTCKMNDQSLAVQAYQQHIPLEKLRAEVGGFEHDQLQLHWQTPAGAYMLIAKDKTAQKLLNQHLAGQPVAGHTSWKVATHSQRWVWHSLWYGAGLLVLAVVIGFWQYDRLLTWVTNRVPVETEYKLGQAVLQSYGKTQDRIQTGAAVDFVKQLGSTLTQGSRYQYQWIVVRDDMVNAFAMPGGIVIVNTGLLKRAANPNEVAAVLAHEIQHVEQRHSLKNMLNSAGVATVVMLVLGDANTAMIMIAHQVSNQYFSRKVEAEADLKGAQLLIKRGIQADGMPSFFKKLAAEYKGQQALPEWISSHPDTLKRIALAEAFVKQHPCTTCKALSWDQEAILININEKTIAAPEASSGKL